MGRQIIKQPNGYYGIFSSIVDDFIFLDATPQDIIDFFMEEEMERVTKFVNETVEKLAKGEKPYSQFTMSWEEVMKFRKAVHGENVKPIELKRKPIDPNNINP